jgi:hypothetical protein
MEHPPHHGGAERVVAERHPGGVGHDEREGDGSALLLHQLGQHRAGQVEPDHRHAGSVEGKRDEAGPYAHLQAATPSGELGSQQLDGRPLRLGEERSGAVVKLGGAVERNGLGAHGEPHFTTASR